MMHKLWVPALVIVIIMVLGQFSSDSSITGGEKPKINIYGTLLDRTGTSYHVENITVSGLYKQIPFYKIPPRSDMNPDINTTRIDLAELYQIMVPYTAENSPRIHRFKNREYIEIIVISNDSKKTQNNYIIERRKRILCDEQNEMGPVEKELAFEAVDTVTINGYKEQDQRPKKKVKN